MSSVHYAEFLKWDELYVLLVRSPHLSKENGLMEIILKNNAPKRIIDLVTELIPQHIVDNSIPNIGTKEYINYQTQLLSEWRKNPKIGFVENPINLNN